MNNWVIVALLAAIGCIILFRGQFKFKEQEGIKAKVKQENGNMKFECPVSYQGGFPPMPRPSLLTVGFCDDDLILFDSKGNYGRVNYNCFNKIDKFTTRKDADLKNKSVVLWGPLAPIVFKAKLRYFIVIEYIDVNGEENNILLETKELEQQKILYDHLISALRSNKWNRRDLAKAE